MLRYCCAGGFAPAFRLEAQLQQAIVSLVAEALGVAIVPESMAKLGLFGVTFRPLQGAPSVSHAIVWREANANPALRNFLRVAGALA